MVWPVIGGLFGAVGGIAGAMAESQAANTNYAINLMNYYARERERRDTVRQADESRADARLGSTDAQGNRTYFKEGVGWVSELSPGQREISDAQDNELKRILGEDLPQRRAQLRRNNDRRRDEDYIASGLSNQLRKMQPEEPSGVAARVYGAKAKGINQGANEALETAMRKSIRTGASNTGKLMEDMNRSRMDALSDASVEAEIGSRDKANADFAAKRADVGNLYNLFATRAGAMPDTSFAPQNITGVTSNQMNQNANLASGKDNALINAIAQQGGTLDYVTPNYGIGNAIGALTGVTQGMQTQQSIDKRDEMNNMLMQYMTQNGQFGSGGSFAPLLANSGAF